MQQVSAIHLVSDISISCKNSDITRGQWPNLPRTLSREKLSTMSTMHEPLE